MGGRNRIVVDYGDLETLALLDVIDIETGKADLDEFDRVQWPWKVEKKLIASGFSDLMGGEIPEGEEGFVLYWPHHDYRVKMKSAEYLRLHKIIFGLSERSVWASLGAGRTVEQICVDIPDEFHDWVKSVAKRLQNEQREVERKVIGGFVDAMTKLEMDPLSYFDGREVPSPTFRRDFANLIKSHPYKGYIFSYLDKKDVKAAIFADLKPTGSVTPMGASHSEDEA